MNANRAKVTQALAFALLLQAGCASVPAGAPLRSSPANVYAIEDPGGEATESCTFMVILPANAALLSAQWVVLSGARELESRSLTQDGLRGMTIVAGSRSVVRLQVRRAKADAFDRIRGTIRLDRGEELPFDVPVMRYTPKTKLVFPFRGKGMVSAGAVNDGGHRNSSGQFAVDALALTDDYAPMTCAESKNECSAGFGRREIVAPADGTVVRAWNDIPDNPSWEVADRKLFTRPDGSVADTGNSVVIDHGNGEFSVIAHMKLGSLTVGVGQFVKQGEKIGLLGNSGESYGPHLHYQLQNGPDLNRADALPPRFEGGPARLIRGAYFEVP